MFFSTPEEKEVEDSEDRTNVSFVFSYIKKETELQITLCPLFYKVGNAAALF